MNSNISNNQTFTIKSGMLLHMIGIGGIGMSGLAQMLVALGCKVTGSDRGLNLPENQRIFSALRGQGIMLYEQNGSYIKDGRPDALIYSTAIEKDNPDFVCAEGVAQIHRSAALSAAMLASGTRMIAVTGSCGKTTVTSWLAETLDNIGENPSFLTGGLVKKFARDGYAGNYFHGDDKYFVFEADESDKSLTAYHPDYALVLNIGTDHYSKDELAEVFKAFLRNVKIGAVIEENVYNVIKDEIPLHLKIKTFSSSVNDKSSSDWWLSSYKASADGVTAVFNSKYTVSLPAPGLHTAANALSIAAMLEMMGVNVDNAINALQSFGGVWRRFDFAGRMSTGAKVYDDYAHNVEKIMSCINAAREVTAGRIYAVFQPHGFGPLGFMKDEMFSVLEKSLSPDDVFALLPVYYAGGTTSFKPSSEEVCNEYKTKASKNYMHFKTRSAAAEFFKANTSGNDTIIVMGARDNSLSDWAVQLSKL